MLIVIGRKGVSSCATDTARLWRQASTRSTLLIPFNWILFIYDFVIRGWVKSIINRLREKRKCNVNYFSCRDQYCFLLLLLFCTQIDCFWVMQLWHSWIFRNIQSLIAAVHATIDLVGCSWAALWQIWRFSSHVTSSQSRMYKFYIYIYLPIFTAKLLC